LIDIFIKCIFNSRSVGRRWCRKLDRILTFNKLEILVVGIGNLGCVGPGIEIGVDRNRGSFANRFGQIASDVLLAMPPVAKIKDTAMTPTAIPSEVKMVRPLLL
jgi:hypothetical protein